MEQQLALNCLLIWLFLRILELYLCALFLQLYKTRPGIITEIFFLIFRPSSLKIYSSNATKSHHICMLYFKLLPHHVKYIWKILLKGPVFYNINNILLFQKEASQQCVFQVLSFCRPLFINKDDFLCLRLYEHIYSSVQTVAPHFSLLKIPHWLLIWISIDCITDQVFFCFPLFSKPSILTSLLHFVLNQSFLFTFKVFFVSC